MFLCKCEFLWTRLESIFILDAHSLYCGEAKFGVDGVPIVVSVALAI